MRRVNPDERVPVTIVLNGREVTGQATSRMLLTDFLRSELGQTGTHVGCEHGVCGCCTVRMDGVAARSCLTLAVQAHGRAIDTVEGLASSKDALDALQRAFRKHHALQCGFCTPGILMSFSDFLARRPDADDDEIREVLGGHICRCTGYAGLMAAISEAAAELRGSRGEDAADADAGSTEATGAA